MRLPQWPTAILGKMQVIENNGTTIAIELPNLR